MAPKPKNWSRQYFSKQANGKFSCNFCSNEYGEKVDKWQHHLKVNCIYKLLRKKAELDVLLTRVIFILFL